MSGSLLTADQVARILGVPKSWVYEQSRSGRIPTVTLGRYRRYRAESIAAWVEQLESGRERGAPSGRGSP
jgi:excisionase family DNA binding protein